MVGDVSDNVQEIALMVKLSFIEQPNIMITRIAGEFKVEKTVPTDAVNENVRAIIDFIGLKYYFR